MNTPTEHQEQASLIKWANLQKKIYPELEYLFAVPNGANKSKVARKQFKDEGLKSGVPDLILPVARGGFHHLYIEMKRTKGGKVSDNQKKWVAFLNANGSKAVICKGWLEAKEEILKYLKKD